MNLLFVASECAPFVKTGGLADVIGAVPKSLAGLGVQVKILLPAYPDLRALIQRGHSVLHLPDLFGGSADVISVQAEGLDLLLLDAPHLFDRPGNIYLDASGADWADNYLRFGALSYVGSVIALDGLGAWRPDLVNAHDWQAGLVAAYLRQSGRRAPPVVLTIHNIAFQGLFGAEVRHELGLVDALFTPEGVEYFGMVSFLKAGIALSDKITTVSPTYAKEVLSHAFGMGLEGILQARNADLVGILNGIDTEVWNPETDAALAQTYGVRSLKRKSVNKAAVEARFGLSSHAPGPLFCVISRLTTQKGLDLLLEAIPALVAQGAKLAVLGSGDKGMERAFVTASRRFEGAVGVIIGYDEALSHLLQGGSDAILIPSRFEPCGLTQLYGLRYGTVPVVSRTGGLADTVIDANAAAVSAGCATGLQFSPVTLAGLEEAIARTCTLFRQQKVWGAMMRRGMVHPVGWDRSARAYLDVFHASLQQADH
ncbi:MAG: starch synthase [Paracoccaceae bacterium]|jgi:starch synthase